MKLPEPDQHPRAGRCRRTRAGRRKKKMGRRPYTQFGVSDFFLSFLHTQRELKVLTQTPYRVLHSTPPAAKLLSSWVPFELARVPFTALLLRRKYVLWFTKRTLRSALARHWARDWRAQKRIVRWQIGPQDGVLMTPYPDVCRSALVRFGR